MTNLNKWQKQYIDTYYNGKMPRTKIGKYDLELLSKIKDFVKVSFPNEDKILTVTLDKNDIPNNLIAVRTLVSNLHLWMERGYKITTF